MRLVEDVVLAGLLRGPSRVHDHHVVGDVRDHAEVMRDHDERGVGLLLQPQQQVDDLCLDGRVQRGGRLVRDDQLAGSATAPWRSWRAAASRRRTGAGSRSPARPAAGSPPGRADRRLARSPRFLLTDLSCARIISTICQPTLYSGCRLVSGSWKITAICAPRTLRSWSRPERRAGRCRRRRPCPRSRPPGVSPSSVWVSTVLPLPDSPTMPSVRPLSTLNDTPRTAWTTPSAVGKLTRRSVTSSRLTSSLRCDCLAAAGRARCESARLSLRSVPSLHSVPPAVVRDQRVRILRALRPAGYALAYPAGPGAS